MTVTLSRAMISAPPIARRSWPRVALGLLIRLVLPAAAFAYLFSRVNLGEVAGALGRIRAAAALASLGWVCLGVVLGVIRWRFLLRAAGAQGLPRWSVLLRLYLVGMFYNLLPGAVGGDVYRGYATRALFTESDSARAFAVALMERVLGLAGLFALAALAVPLSPFATTALLLYAALTLGAVPLGMTVLVWGPRLSARLPALARRPLELLTVVNRPAPLAVALALSIITHITASMNGYVVVRDLVPTASFGGSMVIFPIGTLASYFPLTIAGAGARDAVLVLLLAKIGVEQAHALVTSLAMLACNLIVSGIGGLLQLAGFSASAVERAGLPSTARRSSRDD